MSGLVAIVARDVVLALRAGGGAVQAALFFALAVLVFALAVGPDLDTLAELAAPVLWTAALLSTLVSLDRIFQADFEDGSLDVMIETADLLELVVLAKAVAHWLTSALPLIIAAPVLALLLNLPQEGYGPLLLSLAIGTPALSLIGALGAALTLGMRRAGALVSILVGPLYAPTLIFGVGAAKAGLEGAPSYGPSLLLLGAVTLFAAALAPLAGAAAIRFNMR
ncbi:heme exporter protein CcmB [Amphiplicatus metriothermophilus]|uniref:Heme exporter protein B n=1 Tax=Amphiplicatus metriothermophilus TaxID=1519374 RepID=A0A239PQA9_9PROT|nr:heme exporter protein CcmB [Amphiplicatus metriothermophilus]MBB5518521.1 heme exporter protein B [Amphiplicatus metriothermophilus]SNT72318.1 heme exporter protein B [Amphiplicatus metriothermophilus]